MAHVVRGAQNTLINMERRQHFQRAMELNMSIGSDTMRDLIKGYLDKKGLTLKEHLNEDFVKEKLKLYKKLCAENFHTLCSGDPSLEQMDVSVLTVLILNTFPTQLSSDNRKRVKGLRDMRNKLAHVVKAELDDDTLFKESFQMIVGLAKEIGPKNDYAFSLIKTINELRKRELVNCRSNLERVIINNEMFVIKMVESSEKDSVDADETMIKIGLTKWVRQLSRGLNVGVFIRELKDKGVINDTLKRQIEENYSYEEQMQVLILHMLNETRFNLCELCRCLRSIAPRLADLIENTNTDGKEIEKYLEDYEKQNVARILKETFVEAEDHSVSTDRVHIIVEQKIELVLDFIKIRSCVLECFSTVRHMENDGSFAGLTWKTLESPVEETLAEENMDQTGISEMTCEDFANYVAETLSKVKVSLYDPFKKAFLNESISPKAFVDMTKDEMKETFQPYLEATKFGIGLQKELSLIQRQIKNENITINSDNIGLLRPFDTPCGNLTYSKCNVRPDTGNLLVPKHEFRFLPSNNQYTRYYVAKEIVKFAAASINGRKNGTIHFGIKPLKCQIGQIIGIASNNECIKCLNDEIARSVEVCFKEYASVVFRCIRPVQIIPIENGRVVIEVDVVPFSKHISSQLLSMDFPPKGYQHRQCFVFGVKPDWQILPIAANKVKQVEEVYTKVLQERALLEEANDQSGDKRVRLRKNLVKMLTGGNKYITDEFVPIIVSGNITGLSKEETLRKELDMKRAFKSAKLVLDFDSSVKLRSKVEDDQMLFTVKTAEDLTLQADLSHTSPTWVYCNGNEELSKENMTMENWLEERSDGVKNALDVMKKLIPKTRAKVVFLLFQANSTERDPIHEAARMSILSSFRNQCIVIAENDEIIKDLKKELVGTVGERKIDNFFHTGLAWDEISQLLNSVCRRNPDVVCKLPRCDGHFAEMTKKEREELKFTDIDILSGEECIDEESKMPDQERKVNRNEIQERFYRGGQCSWWNFYYQTHVGKRDLFDRHKGDINEKLTGNKGEALIEIHDIEHHPGAGGSTLGRHLLWHFSQFKQTPEKAYRCCAVRNTSVIEDTINQIEKFRSFKDGDCPKPFIVLADNKSEDNVILLKTKLHELAYKTGSPGKLFCLILIINRMPITHDESEGKPLLKHRLSTTEQNWFESKYREMENSDDIDVKTLIAFNFMRKSFDISYMKKTVDSIMQGVSKKEMNVLRCLALISSYESDHPVPENVFDYMMNEQIDTELLFGQPWGIAHSVPELHNLAKLRNETWNMHMSDAMNLLIAKKEDQDFYNSGVCLISQLLAKTVLEYIKTNEGLTLESIVDSVLDLVETQQKETNPMSKRFVKIVCSLFKTRQLLESERGDLKEKFSDLVLELAHSVEGDTDAKSGQRVLRVTQRCFDITEDAMVGQQLARFNIHIKEFEAAEIAIKRSLEKRPQSSYLLDTYGQIFKSKMEFLIESATQNGSKINDDVGSEIIDLAFQAIEKFTEGQEIAVSLEEDTNWGCFNTEVKTALYLLEKFEKFECFTTRQAFVSFLNEDHFEVNDSTLLGLIAKCPSLENLRLGTPAQCHLETSLRSLEERNYQVKRQLYTIYSENETLLLRLRERFERFYGSRDSTSKYQFTYGIGLKPLMVAKEQKQYLLARRVKEAKRNLETFDQRQADERDLLVYIGNNIITLSSLVAGKDTDMCNITEYKRLLSYSTRLVSIQTTSPRSKRLYLETFLYYAMLHWPLKSRTTLDLDVLARPTVYEQLIKQWEDAYNANFYIKSTEQCRKNRPKNYFALGKGTPGNDIVDLEAIRKEWMNRKKKSTGRVRRPVFADFFWRESFVEERLERLNGTVDGSGHVVIHKAEYPLGTHIFRINTYYPCTALSNRIVTFVLGFTWKGPTAFDVEEKGKTTSRGPTGTDDGPSSLNSETENETTQADGEKAARKLSQSTSMTYVPTSTNRKSTGVKIESESLPQPSGGPTEGADGICESAHAEANAKSESNSCVQQTVRKSRRQRKNNNRK
ncbi:sterile alpha motif domain-containing protein 9-like [Mercenaria mercenaria]|uniref:sterile alpha motif domain-containing protein 9-like n=1 Tax=Mercenaria mercenaria TaxID=6596 RepID=UPI00234E4E91|nr:sterile alpha motif domain-containing protein 9-like [Mercenaria mercenaria]